MEKKSGIQYYESKDPSNIDRRAGTAAGEVRGAGSGAGHRIRTENTGREDLDVLFPAYGDGRNQAVNRARRQAGAGTAAPGYRKAGSAAYGSTARGRSSSAAAADAADGKGKRAQGRNPRRTSRGYSYENADLSEEAEERRQARRRHQREEQRQQRARAVRRMRTLAVLGAVLLVILVFTGTRLIHKAWAKSKLSDSVLGYRSTMERYAQQEGVEEYVDTLLAIMMVESEGQGKDVMQSSESKGLARNSLKPEESIEQACIYYAALIEISRDLGIDDEKAVIQAYNFGPGYLSYLSEHGGKHRQKYAIEYARELSGGEKIRYLHLYAIRKNGGWIYKFGNMFYDALVEQYM